MKKRLKKKQLKKAETAVHKIPKICARICPICGRHLFHSRDFFLCSICHKTYSLSETSLTTDPLPAEEQEEITAAYRLYHMNQV